MDNFGNIDNSQYLKLAEDLKNIAEEREQKVAVELIDRAIRNLSTGTFSLAVLGMVKRGKSTFCNALLGARSDVYAPVGKTPVSNAVTFFKKGPQNAEVTFFDGSKQNINISDIPCYITEQQNPGNNRGVSNITIQDNFERLPNGVMLMDTPGEGSFNQHHDDLLYKFLPMVDAGIFLITAYSPITEAELEFLQDIVKNDAQKIFFAINRVDQTDESDLKEAIEHNLNILAHAGITVNKIYPVSAKMALEGNWAGSGMQALVKDVNNYLEKEKYRIPRLRFMNRILPVIDPLYNGVCEEISARSKSEDELKKDIENLTDKGEKLEADQNRMLAQLKAVWVQAENKLVQDIDAALYHINSQMSAYIDSIGFLNCNNAKKDFCNKFSQLTENVMSLVFNEFDSKIMEEIKMLPLQFNGMHFGLNSRNYHHTFMNGNSDGIFKTVLKIIPLVGAVIHLHSISSAKADLRKQMPIVMDDMKNFFSAQIASLQDTKKDFFEELEELFILEISPTVQALQNALTAHGELDKKTQEQLNIAKNMLAQLKQEAADLYASVEN